MLLNAGPLDAPAGGSRYHLRIALELERLGAEVVRVELPGAWPDGTWGDRPAGPWLVDGLAWPVLAGDAPEGCVVIHHLPLHYEHPEWAERERVALRKAHRVIATSPWAADALAEMGVQRDRLAVVVPGTDASTLVREPVPGRALAVGTVCERKGQLEISGPGVFLAGIAEGAYARACEDRGATLLGALGFEELEGEYARASLFVQASRWETWGIALCEAMARGLPVVARSIPATRHLAPHAVVDGDLREAMHRMLEDPDRLARLCRESRKAAAALPNWAEQGRRLLDTLKA